MAPTPLQVGSPIRSVSPPERPPALAARSRLGSATDPSMPPRVSRIRTPR